MLPKYKEAVHNLSLREDVKVSYIARMVAYTILDNADGSQEIELIPAENGGVDIVFWNTGDDGNIDVFINIAPNGLFSVDAL